MHQPAAAQECTFDKATWDKFDATTKAMLEEAGKKTTIDSWMAINYQDSEALEKFKKEGVEIIRVDDSYIAAWKKATVEWEDKYAAEGGWFKKALDHKRAFQARWDGAKAYRVELK